MADTSGLLAAILGPTYGLLTPNYGVQKPYMFGGGPTGLVRPVQSPIMSPLGVAMMDPASGGSETGVPGAAASSNVSTAGPTTPNQVPDMGPLGRSALAQDAANRFGVTNSMFRLMGMLGGPLIDLGIKGLKAAMIADNAARLAKQLDAQARQGRAIGFDPDPTGFSPVGPQSAISPAAEFGLQQNFSQVTPAEMALARAIGNRADTPDDPTDVTDPGDLTGLTDQSEGGVTGGGGGPAGGGSGAGGGSAAGPSGDASDAEHQGGMIRDRAPRGGEERIRALAGEYVVQRGPAQKYRKLLEAINAGNAKAIRHYAASGRSFDTGGAVPHRMLASLQGGEYVIRPERARKHRRLLDAINRGTPAEVRRMARRVAQ